jgi:hypothetical protein
MADEPEIVTPTEARGGVTNHNVRYVLIASLVLALIGFIYSFAITPEERVEGSASDYRQAGENRPAGAVGENPGGGPAAGEATSN